MPRMRGGGERITTTVEMSRNREVESKWPHVTEEVLRKTVAARNATEQTKLGIVAYKRKGEWESQAKKAERWLGERKNEILCGSERL